MQVADIEIPSEKIIYFGLIVNELLASTFEHSLGSNHDISIEVAPYQNGYRFAYKSSSGHWPDATIGKGNSLVGQLVERVGGTNFVFDVAAGHYGFEFHG